MIEHHHDPLDRTRPPLDLTARLGENVPAAIAGLTIAIAALLVAGALLAVVRGAEGYFALSPGSAPTITSSAGCKATAAGEDLVLPDGHPCARLVVPASRDHGLDGTLMMVDVLEGRATPWQYVLKKLGLLHVFAKGTQLFTSSQILGNTPASQLLCQNDQEMHGATSSAAVVALRRLGYSVRENDLGAQIDEVVPGSPAAAAGVQCNDVVTAFNGSPVRTSTGLVAKIQALKPGDLARLTVSRIGANGQSATVTLEPRLGGTPAVGTSPAKPRHPFLGISTETRVTFTLPFNVSVDVGPIGGPSAGLALTLGLLDVLSNGKLTGGHQVAATGTINLDATVGDVGGVAQKALAVRRAGAKYFIVPKGELKDALSEAGSMKVFGVTTLQQALDVLESIGGQVPPPVTGHNG